MPTKQKLFLTSFFIISLLSGCGKKDQENKRASSSQATTQTAPARSGNSISYRILETSGVQSQQNGSNAPVSIGLIKNGDHFVAAASVVVPSAIPNRLPLVVTLSDIPVADYVVEGTITKGTNNVRTLAPTLFSMRKDSAVQIRFLIDDLRSLLGDNAHETVSVSMRLAREDQRDSFQVVFNVQSPPSALLQTVFFPLSRFESERHAQVPARLRRIRLINGMSLDLIGVLELTNQEAEEVIASFPAELFHESSLINRITAVSASECSSQVSENVSRSKIEGTLHLLPLTVDPQDLTHVAVPVGSASYLGIYAERQDFYRLPPSTVANQTVPTRCMARCNRGAEGDWADLGKWGDDCLACGRSPGNTGTQCFGCMRAHREWCRWQDWSSWRDFMNVQTGSRFEIDVETNPQTSGQSGELHFVFRSQHPSIPSRAVRVISTHVSINE